ncbi:uncharacterized protein EI90DRAFT_3124065 [Cantharellus anzutake]|uniref:uncharacterized protein n=1 Tax=Cantharellus anzutake TaxID=1750568 RepID=UPI001906F4E9|nr:uncharacterized protein EI90DRAFT_3124065 [Cantharellus anzutake]KAF8330863.1 hypothetical protein EI90DRAFT_3124065 [Cantharellus anzutake]
MYKRLASSAKHVSIQLLEEHICTSRRKEWRGKTKEGDMAAQALVMEQMIESPLPSHLTVQTTWINTVVLPPPPPYKFNGDPTDTTTVAG